MNFVLPGKIWKACQSTSPSNKMLRNSSTFSSIEFKLLSNQLLSDMSFRMSMVEKYAI